MPLAVYVEYENIYSNNYVVLCINTIISNNDIDNKYLSISFATICEIIFNILCF